MRVALTTLGCRLNQSETDAIEAMLVAAGHEIVARPEDAELFVLNSCTITHEADADARQLVRKARRRNAELKILVTGCYANSDPDGLAALPEVDAVVGNGDKHTLLSQLPSMRRRQGAEPALVSVSALKRRRTFDPLPAEAPLRRTRFLLKVQDGCNYRCSFCIVPSVRGPSRSSSPDEVLVALDKVVAQGVPEVVLTGIHLGTYGRDLRPRRTLAELVAMMLPRLGRSRLRISSLDPHEVDDDLVSLLAAHGDKLCRHLHLPVQSGDPDVLRRMRRGHTVDDFAELSHTLARRVPGIAIGTDVIVGFPGEDEAAFVRTHDLLERLPLAYHHVFSYSEREGTAAVSLPDSVAPQDRVARNRVLRDLSHRQAAAFARRCGGQTFDAVIEVGRGPRVGKFWALTDNYVRTPLLLEGATGWSGFRRATVRLDSEGRVASLA